MLFLLNFEALLCTRVNIVLSEMSACGMLLSNLIEVEVEERGIYTNSFTINVNFRIREIPILKENICLKYEGIS